jgi:outer membrane protein assembly factor BamB
LGITRLPSPVIKLFQGEHPTLQLSNQTFWHAVGDRLVRIPIPLPVAIQILDITRSSIWGYDGEKGRLIEYSLETKSEKYSSPIKGQLLQWFRLNNGDWFLMTPQTMELRRSGKIIWSRKNNLPSCEPTTESFSARQILLNCPDNALHPIELHDGSESESISLLDPIDRVISSPDGIWILNSSNVWFFKPHKSRQPIWQQSFHSIQSVLLLEDKLAVLEGDGSLNLLDARSATLISRTRMEPGQLFRLDHRIGLLTKDGNLQILDMNGLPLWRYQAGQAPASLPIMGEHSLLLPLADGRVVSLNTQYYGTPKSALQLRTESLEELALADDWDSLIHVSDSILGVEPGNASAWMHKARYFSERTNRNDSAMVAWSKAARHSRNLGSGTQQQILRPYARRIGASWIQYLPPSTQSYPKLFGDQKMLYTIDAGNRSLVAMDQTSGQFRWRAPTQAIEPGFITENDGRLLAIASGFEISILDLNQKGRLLGTLSLPGKVFQISMSRNAIFVSTWNGFLLRFQKKGLEPSWSRKAFNSGAMLVADEGMIYGLSVDGELGVFTTESGVSHQPTQNIGVIPSHMVLSDSTLLLTNQDGLMFGFSARTFEKRWEYSLGSQVFSMQALPDDLESNKVIIGLANQKITVFDINKQMPVWSFQGTSSVYIQPEIVQGQVFIDQGSSVISLDQATGKRIRSLPVPDGAGPVWANESTVFTSSPQGLLFAFPLWRDRQ